MAINPTKTSLRLRDKVLLPARRAGAQSTKADLS
jgi:hypothetical protein